MPDLTVQYAKRAEEVGIKSRVSHRRRKRTFDSRTPTPHAFTWYLLVPLGNSRVVSEDNSILHVGVSLCVESTSGIRRRDALDASL